MKRRTPKREPGDETRDDDAVDGASPVPDAGYVSASTAIAAFLGAPPVDPGRYAAEGDDARSDRA